jgi:predicted PurR-regulated permease PerM
MLGSVCLVVVTLYFAREVLIPVALATLFSFLLAPLVRRLEHVRLPRSLAVVVVVLLAFAVIGGVGYVVYNQTGTLNGQLPTYKKNIAETVKRIRGPGGIVSVMSNANAEMKQVFNEPTTKPGTNAAPAAIPVYMVNPSQSGNSSAPLDLVGTVGGAILGPVGTAFIVLVFTVFMLMQREDLRDRMIRLVGRDRLTTTTKALDDAAERVSRYLLMQSIVNGGVGIAVTIALWTMGRINRTPFPSPALWGLLAMLLRFIPYIGIWVAALAPILLSLAVFGTVKMAVVTLFIYGGIEITAANAIEPLLYGSSTGIATLAVLIAAAFWTWLWGTVGLFLSTPLTVCLVVMGKYVPQLDFLTILLAEEPALDPPDRVYQRLMAMDQEEAADLVDEYFRTLALEEIYDAVLCPVLAMAKQDHYHDNLDDERYAFILRGIRDIMDELADQQKITAAKAISQPPASPPSNAGARVMLPKDCVVKVVCLPAADEADEIAGMMFAHLLEVRGYCVTVVSVTQLASEMLVTVEESKADLVCVSALPPAAVTHARYLCKRLQGKLPDVNVVIGLWGMSGDLAKARDRVACVHSAQLASKFSQGVDLVHQMVQPVIMQRGQQPG